MNDTKPHAIELKCDPEYPRTGEADARADCCYKEFHDARIAHALMKAIEECRQTRAADNCEEDWIKHRAAEILASEFGIKP